MPHVLLIEDDADLRLALAIVLQSAYCDGPVFRHFTNGLWLMIDLGIGINTVDLSFEAWSWLKPH